MLVLRRVTGIGLEHEAFQVRTDVRHRSGCSYLTKLGIDFLGLGTLTPSPRLELALQDCRCCLQNRDRNPNMSSHLRSLFSSARSPTEPLMTLGTPTKQIRSFVPLSLIPNGHTDSYTSIPSQAPIRLTTHCDDSPNRGSQSSDSYS